MVRYHIKGFRRDKKWQYVVKARGDTGKRARVVVVDVAPEETTAALATAVETARLGVAPVKA